MLEGFEFAKQAALAVAEKKASRIVILDLKECTDLCDHMLICSGSNDRQTKAISKALMEHFKTKFKIIPFAVEGENNGHWIVQDYGSLIVHIFFDYVRDFYALEELWPEAKVIRAKVNE